MDPFDFSEFETPSTTGDGRSEAESKTKSHSDPFDDIFGDPLGSSCSTTDTAKPTESTPKLSSTKGSNLLFSLDEGVGNSATPAPPIGGNDLFASLENTVGKDDDQPNSSLFDDLLDFSSTKTSDESTEVAKNDVTIPTPAPETKPASKVDLLFGVDDDLVEPANSDLEVKAQNPDILDFFDRSPPVLPEISTMDSPDNLAADPFDSNNDIFDDVDKISKEKSPDILVTAASFDQALDRENETKTNEAEEKKDESVKEKKSDRSSLGDASDKADSTRGSTSDQDLDFSILESPDMSHLNFDLTKHKRTLSKKGSIAGRKRPKRATIWTGDNNEDSIFQDSTEPKPSKAVSDDELDGSAGLKGENAPAAEEEPQREVIPPKKSPGIKIPGLLEGLNKSKAFNRAEKKTSPGTEATQSMEPNINSPSKSSPDPGTSAPVIRPKPVALPRVLPKPTPKTLKDSQNLTTAGETMAKPSSNSSLPTKAHSFREPRTSPAGSTRVLPPLSDLKKSPLGQGSLKRETKVPPPVPNKPVTPAKPKRSSLASSSFSVGDRVALTAKKDTERSSQLLTQTNGGCNSPSLSSVFLDKNSSAVPKSGVPDNDNSFNSSTSNTISPVKKIEPSTTIRSPAVPPIKSSFKPGEGLRGLKKIDKENKDDVFSSSLDVKDNAGSPIMSSAVIIDKSEIPSIDSSEQLKPRKSSFSATMPVKSPSTNDKPPSIPIGRKGSITGTAYNPIGFRSHSNSIDGESKSRGNSVSSSDGSPLPGAVIMNPLSVSASSSIMKPRGDSINSFDGQRSRDGSFNSSATIELKTNTEKLADSRISDIKLSPSTEIKNGLGKINRAEENTKEAVEKTNKVIRDQNKTAADAMSPTKTNGTSSSEKTAEVSSEKTSPWGVRLRKIERKEPPPETATPKEEDTEATPINWRKQLSTKRRSTASLKEPEKPAEEKSPAWARASIQRRQRLVDSGFINAEAK